MSASLSSSTRPSKDVPTMARKHPPSRDNPLSIPFDPSPAQLPIPVTAHTNTTRKPRLLDPFAARWRAVRTYVKRTLAPPQVAAVAPEDDEPLPQTPRKDPHRFPAPDEVDEVVVDRSWADDFVADASSDAADTASTHSSIGDTSTDEHQRGFWMRYRLFAALADFYMPRFSAPEEETHYQKEVWQQTKRLSLWSSVFFIASCALAIGTVRDPVVLADKIFFYCISPLLALPLVFMCAYNYPLNHPYVFQAFLAVSTWSWPFYQVLFAYFCGFYEPADRLFSCGKKDFLSTFYYTAALQAVALFGAALKRLPATLGAVAFFAMTCATIVPLWDGYIINLINFVIFQCLLLYLHGKKEQSSRKLYSLRMQLKTQFQRTRRAQINERRAADSKRRLTSYVFHEVRVPLNTALLAVQNMASRPIPKDHEVEFSALEGSLSMMSKVLNDVLDFNRMDSGRLESLSRPYAFHKVLRSLFIPLRLAADARKLEFITDLDMRIDEVARRATYQHMEASPEAIAQHLRDQPSGEGVMGMVVGDETRLRQIITNLASNACKFTPAGGKLTIVTRLVVPAPEAPPRPASDPGGHAYMQKREPDNVPERRESVDGGSRRSLTETHLSMHNASAHNNNDNSDFFRTAKSTSTVPPPVERIVVRIEVTDTGSGIPPKDMVECKLFSAFNQTEQGRQQGGKGTGLGLALVRQIVKLSGGRLGLRSKVGVGSTFWVELPLGVGCAAMTPSTPMTPPSTEHASTALHHIAGQPSSPGSLSSVTVAVDAAAMITAQAPPPSIRSSSALHGLMDQGGRVELMLMKYDSHSLVPTRTLGDRSTGTEYPLSAPPTAEETPPPPLPPESLGGPIPPPLEALDTVRPVRRAARPTYVPLPNPRSFTLEPPPPSSGSGSGSGSSLSTGLASLSSSPSGLVGEPGIPVEQGLRVLVVDDDAMTRALMTRMLERMGCRVATAENGEAALQRIVAVYSPPAVAEGEDRGCDVVEEVGRREKEQQRFAVVFLDNQMPKLSGVKMVARLREMGRTDFVVGGNRSVFILRGSKTLDLDIPLGNALLTDQKEYLDAGADHVLTKPVLEASLRAMLALADARKKTLLDEAVDGP
ncbi:hypothetical protein C8J57DRAFT_1173204 [Mycena rebaudengoi]|nr:hypothetical protein C8J57DRAFT_1173204 [Mycena rebaudengoi]